MRLLALLSSLLLLAPLPVAAAEGDKPSRYDIEVLVFENRLPELVGDEAGCGIPGPEDLEVLHPPGAEAAAEGVLRLLASRRRFAGRRARAQPVCWLV